MDMSQTVLDHLACLVGSAALVLTAPVRSARLDLCRATVKLLALAVCPDRSRQKEV